MKVLLCTKSFPPEIGGSSYLIYELVHHWKENQLIVVHGVNSHRKTNKITHPYTVKKVVLAGWRWFSLKVQKRKPSWLIPVVKRALIRMIRKQKPDLLYLHYPNAPFIIAGYQAAKKLELPYIVYFDILWDQNGSVKEEELASIYEHDIVKGAKKHYAITEFAASYLTEKHGVSFEVIPHTLNRKDIQTNNTQKRISSSPYKIHLAGGVNPKMNADSIFRFHKALQKTGLPYEMEICTLTIPESLSRDPNIYLRYYSKNELIESQKKADLLLLPQAFENANPIMIQNNLPTKAMEYLCSGSPILVHSPADSYLTWLAKKHGFGLVVDQPDIDLLAQAIKRILTDSTLIGDICQNSLKFAQSRCSDIWSAKLYLDFEKIMKLSKNDL